MAGKKNRKHKRNIERPAQKRYVAEKRWIKNKQLKLDRHLKKHPNDKQSINNLGKSIILLTIRKITYLDGKDGLGYRKRIIHR